MAANGIRRPLEKEGVVMKCEVCHVATTERLCPQCLEDELIAAVKADILPDEMTHDEWISIRRQYSAAKEEV